VGKTNKKVNHIKKKGGRSVVLRRSQDKGISWRALEGEVRFEEEEEEEGKRDTDE